VHLDPGPGAQRPPPAGRRATGCHVVNIRGNSYRMREHADLRLALRPSPDGTTAETILRRRKKEAAAH
jgi:hypothetical protein